MPHHVERDGNVGAGVQHSPLKADHQLSSAVILRSTEVISVIGLLCHFGERPLLLLVTIVAEADGTEFDGGLFGGQVQADDLWVAFDREVDGNFLP